MSSSPPTGRTRRSLRRRITILASAAALSVAGLAALATPAPAEPNLQASTVQITGPADPVQAGTSYTYTVTLPGAEDYIANVSGLEVVTTLTGAPATFTAVTSNDPNAVCYLSSTQVDCVNKAGGTTLGRLAASGEAAAQLTDWDLTLTVAPTAAGTVTAEANATTIVPDGGFYGSDTTTTTITAPAFPFTGFFAPVNNLPTENSMKAGRAVPVKFALGGDQGLNIFNAGYPGSQQINCQSGVPISPIEETSDAGNSSLQCDPATGQYTYVWKTDKAWANTCRQLVVQLTDGTNHVADFLFN